MMSVTQEVAYSAWQAAVQAQEERLYGVQETVLKTMAKVALQMKDSQTRWGVVAMAVPYRIDPFGQVPVKIFPAKGASFISTIPVEVFVKEKGSCLEDGDTLSIQLNNESMELTVCNAYRPLFSTFKAGMTEAIHRAVHIRYLSAARANELLEGTPYPGAVVKSVSIEHKS